MGLSKEIFRPKETRVAFSEIKVSRLTKGEAVIGARIPELSRMLAAEEKKEENPQPDNKNVRKDGFEPFVNPEPTNNPLFVNRYNGNFAQQMELNRKGVERVLKIAHLDGQIILTSLNPLRQRSVEANSDGSVTGKRSLFFGEKMQDDEIENPLRRVVPIPEGWRIEINDTRIREELEKGKLTGKKLQKKFIRHFSEQLNQGIMTCTVREKLTGIKDKHFKIKLFDTLGPVVVHSGLSLFWLYVGFSKFSSIIPIIVGIESTYIIMNILIQGDKNYPLRRKMDHKLEYLMPLLEIDKVIRTFAYLSLKGNLVRETKQP